MHRWLVISVEFLTGTFHGKFLGKGGVDTPEYPPSPHRAFQAIISAAHETHLWGDQDPAAFRWLERQAPPEIKAPDRFVARPYTTFVPNNAMDAVAKEWAKGREPKDGHRPESMRPAKIVRPQMLGGDATVHFCYRIEEANWEEAKSHVELLCNRAQVVSRLGAGVDMVLCQGHVLDSDGYDKLQGDTWITDGSEGTTNVHVSGTLEEIDQRFLAWSNSQSDGFLKAQIAGDYVAVQKVHYQRLQDRRRTVYPFMLVNEQGEFFSAPATKALVIGATVRHAIGGKDNKDALAKKLGLPDNVVREYVMGHVPDGKDKGNWLHYIAIPSFGHPKVNGRIKRFMLVEPFSIPNVPHIQEIGPNLERLTFQDYQETIRFKMQALVGKQLRDEDKWMLGRITGKSRRWGSLTPVVLHGYDRYNSRRAVDLFRKQLDQSGCCTPAEFELSEEPLFNGAESASHYQVDDKLPGTRVHATITFAEPVHGPVLVGLGRHRGLGLFAALS